MSYRGGYGGDGGRGRGAGDGGRGRGYGGGRGDGGGYGGRGDGGYGGRGDGGRGRGGDGYGGGRGDGGRGRGGDGYGGGRGDGGRGRGGGGRGGRGGGGFIRPHPAGVLTPQIWAEAAKVPLSKELSQKLTVSAPRSSSLSSIPPARPGFGRIGLRCEVKANHFLVKLAERDLHHYDVAITPEVISKNVCRQILSKLVETYKKTHLGNRMPAYDGMKSLYTAGPFPFSSKEFVVELPPRDSAPNSESKKREFQVVIKFAAKVDSSNLQEYLRGMILESPHVAIQALDVVLRAAKPLDKESVIIGRSFFSTSLGKGQLADGLEFWRGYYQSIRPTQMGLSLNIDASARPFYEPVPVPEFIATSLNLRDLSRPLSDADRVKVKKALRGVTVETNHRGYRKSFKVTGISTESANTLMFSQSDEHTLQMSVSQYFKDKYKISLRYPSLPCIQTGQAKRPISLPMEICTIVGGQKYLKKMNERQVSNLLKATCERPEKREENIKRMVKDNRYGQNSMISTEFGMSISENCTTVNARVLPPPMLMYHERVTPGVGQWNMIGKKMYDGAKVTYWSCINFSNMDPHLVNDICKDLVGMCINKGMKFEANPCVRIRSARPAQIEKGLLDLHTEALQQQKELQLLIIILPDYSGSYGKIKKICETQLGVVTQCLQPKKAAKLDGQYFENVALKINVKAGGKNTVLCDAIGKTIPLLTDSPTMIIGADVTHASPGEDSTASVAAVVGSIDWPDVTRYKGIISAQGHRVEIIQDLYKLVVDPRTGKSEHGGIIRELLKAFYASTKRKPDRIIFYRDGVSEGQFADVLFHEVDAIRKACASLQEGYLPPVTFVVVQKRHHTRFFPVNRDMTDKSGNILPGTVIDTQICHPSQFDFYLNSHAGIQGTSRPTHYHVLHDENNFTPDLLQLLTNSLCYTYARCTRSVSIVPPAYYAHLLAFRARYYLEGTGMSESGSTGGKDMTKGQQLVIQSLPQVMKAVAAVMFFC